MNHHSRILMKTDYNLAAVVAMISVFTIGEQIRKEKL